MKKTKEIIMSLAILIFCVSLMFNWITIQDNNRLRNKIHNLEQVEEKYNIEVENASTCNRTLEETSSKLNETQQTLDKTFAELEQLKKN